MDLRAFELEFVRFLATPFLPKEREEPLSPLHRLEYNIGSLDFLGLVRVHILLDQFVDLFLALFSFLVIFIIFIPI